MIYTRNKDSFKKNTAKVQNNDIRRNIINMVKEVVKRDSCLKTPVQQSSHANENKCKNNQMEGSEQKQTLNNMFKQPKQPIFCQSIYQSEELGTRNRKRSLAIEHVIVYSIKSSDNPSKSSQAQKQYISLLEERLQKMEKDFRNQKQILKNNNKSTNQQQLKQLQRLLKFYHSARNIIVLQSVELLQCKNILLKDLEANDSRLKELNAMMSKSQQFLESNKRGVEKGSPRKPKLQNQNELQFQQLKQQCQYQKKTIQFLRKQAPPGNQFNQIKLLRYQINRVCNENENLLQKLEKIGKKPQLEQNKQNIQRMIKQIKLVATQDLLQKQKIVQKLQNQMEILRQQLKKEEEQNFKLKQQKQCLFSLLEQHKLKIQGLQSNYQQQIHLLKMNTLKRSYQINLDGKEIATTQQLCRELKAYPKYFKLLMSIIDQYETKISQLQEKVCQQRQLKEKFMQWSTQVYHLLQKSELPQQVVQHHMNKLYTFNNKIDCSNIEKFLRQIRSLSIGIDNKQIKQMEAELQEYIISLKARNQVIKQVDCQDGSSVAVSDSFTDQDFD